MVQLIPVHRHDAMQRRGAQLRKCFPAARYSLRSEIATVAPRATLFASAGDVIQVANCVHWNANYALRTSLS